MSFRLEVGLLLWETEDTVLNGAAESDGVRSHSIKDADEDPLLKEGTYNGAEKNHQSEYSEGKST